MIQWWQGLARNQKIGFATAAAFIVLAAVALSYWALRPSYVVLLDNAAPEDSAELISDLESLGAPYKVDQKSGVVLVPAERREELRASITEHGGALKKPAGFELFNNSDFGMTEFSQKINYERGLEGELTRTIMALKGVHYARVHLVMPDSTLFRKDQEQAKASVTLMTEGDRPLPDAQIDGIVKLVAAAVPGLRADAVSVHDSRGVDLTSGLPRASVGSDPVAQRVHDEEMIETRLEAKIYELLRPLFGDGSLAVSVEVQLRMDKVSSSRQDAVLEAPKSTELSQLRNELLGSSSGGGDSVSKPDAGGGLAALSVHADAIVHRGTQYSEQVEKAQGAIERLSVGILVPNTLPAGVSLAQLQELVSAAIGVDGRRNDHITIYPVDTFRKTPNGATADLPSTSAKVASVGLPAEQSSGLAHYGWAAAGIALLLLAFALGRSIGGEPRLTRLERERLIEEIRLSLAEPVEHKERGAL